MDHDLQLRATGKFGPRGERYEIWRDKELIASGYSPEFAACREMQARGYDGFIRLWREGKSHWDLRINIAKGAGRIVVENVKTGPRLVKWVPNDRFDKKAEEGMEEAA